MAGDERPAASRTTCSCTFWCRATAAPRRCAVFDFDDTLAVCVAEATDMRMSLAVEAGYSAFASVLEPRSA